MIEYNAITMGTLTLLYLGTNIYFNQKRKNVITNLNRWVDNYLIPKAITFSNDKEKDQKLKNWISSIIKLK